MADAIATPVERIHARTRADIQGLRAVAVVAVIADHVVGVPSGGFVGVDMFFVISGFLITGLLLREYESTGRISLIGFYRRRVLRILPAAVLVVVVTVILAFLVFNSGRAQQTALDGLWSLLFVANWHFALIGTDYFAAEGPVSPLQHYWSLGVEEQFYLAWPWLLLLTLTLAARRVGSGTERRAGPGPRGVAGLLVLILGGASLLWALAETRDAPTWAYFSTVSRAWELGVGAMLAVVAPRLSRIPSVIRPGLGWLGIGGIAASLFLVRGDLGFPAPGVLLPVLATALVILAGTRPDEARATEPSAADLHPAGLPVETTITDTPVAGPPVAERPSARYALFPLTNPVSRYLGDVSFSLYLWHWPLLVLVASLIPPGTAFFSSVVLILTLGFSVASYHLVEDPIRRSSIVRRRADARPAPGPRPGVRRPMSVRAGTAFALLALATFGSVVAVVTLALA